MSLYVYKLPYKNPFYNLAAEEYLLSEYEKDANDVYLIFYENTNSIILGKTLDVKQEVYTSKKKTPLIVRRSSGGGSVVHFDGNLNYSLLINIDTYKYLINIPNSYTEILGVISKAIYKKLKLEVAGISDISMRRRENLRKISGNAQVRKRKWLLHHGTLLYNFKNIRKISYYLKPPPKEPDYRQSRKHKEFIQTALPYATKNQIIQSITKKIAEKFNQEIILKKLTAKQKNDIRTYTRQFIQERWIFINR